MRHAARTDANQVEVVEALDRLGATVDSLAMVGKGVPDLLVGFRGVNVLLEVKDGNKAASEQKLTDAQVKWHKRWRGQACVVASAGDAVAAVMGAVANNAEERRTTLQSDSQI